MAEARKRRKAPSRKKPAGREPANAVKGDSGSADQPKCWLCSQPLSADMVASVLGPGMFEVHQRCYEQAMRS